MVRLCLLCAASTLLPLFAQTRKGPAPQPAPDVLRAVSVYEWTGDLAKPTAARVVPVSLFIDHQFQDAALYLSRPMPLALEPGNIYALESAGVKQGDVTLINAARTRNASTTTSFDEGWFAYGTFKPVVIPKPYVPSSLVTNAHIITSGEGRPHFGKTPDATTPAASTPAQTTQTPQNQPPADPNRPILHHTAPGDPQQTAPRTTDSQPSSTTPPASTQTSSATPPAAAQIPPTAPAPQTKPDTTNADRPTFPRPTSDQKTQQSSSRRKSRPNDASVTDAGGLLADDPGRPHLHHGGTTGSAAIPALHGLPPDMHQMIAVSDAADRPEHNFAYQWPDATAKSVMISKLETLARAALSKSPVPAAPPASHTHTAHARKAATPPPIVLLDEQLHAYEISYGGVDVFIFTAHTGEGPTLQSVTLLAQPDIYGALHVLLQSVTGATGLDQHPQMRFLDAVDADGDNRAELLFELRGETQRQFALYRIAQGTATQDFLTGTMQ